MNLLVIKTLRDGTIIRTFVNYPTENEATSALYYELWFSTSDENVINVITELISDSGRVHKCERWSGHNEPPVPAEEAVESEGNEGESK